MNESEKHWKQIYSETRGDIVNLAIAGILKTLAQKEANPDAYLDKLEAELVDKINKIERSPTFTPDHRRSIEDGLGDIFILAANLENDTS